MDNTRAIYVNTFAEGAKVSEPQLLDEDNAVMAARGWKRSQTIIHVKLLGVETKVIEGQRKQFLFGDQGVAKVMLPVAPEYSGLDEAADPLSLTDFWVSGVVDDFDFNDEKNRVLVINRVKALERLREINAERVHQGDGRAYGVIQGTRRGAYIMNVGGHTALLPKAWYDWDPEKHGTGKIGEEFPVQIRRTNVSDRIVVSRCHLSDDPNAPTSIRVERGTIVRGTVAFIRNGKLLADIAPGFRVMAEPINMRGIPKVGDRVSIRVLGIRRAGYYGITV